MSQANWYTAQALDVRAQDTRPGVRKYAKAAASRSSRRAAKQTVSVEIAMSGAKPSQLELTLMADDLLANDILMRAHVADEEELELDLDADEDIRHVLEMGSEIPALLEGSLPDWMLDQIEASRGSAFDHLSLFEAKSARRQAVFACDDEGMFA